jgi:hypothetical protein
MKQINLLEILHKHRRTTDYYSDQEYTEKGIFMAMKEACEATVDLCSENAKIKDIKIDYTGVRAGGYYIIKEVDKDSILKTKNQII